jgi:hypothetical protein
MKPVQDKVELSKDFFSIFSTWRMAKQTHELFDRICGRMGY